MANNLETAYTHCMFNLDSVHPHTIPDLHFEHNDGRSWICSCKLPQPLDFEILDQPVTDSMLIFQVAGEISLVESVPLSDREERDEVGNDGVRLACWVEPRPNTASRTLWNHIRQSLDDISEVTGIKLDFSKLYAVDETGMLRLRIGWVPSVLNRTTLPIFREGYPCQLTDILDRQPVQILFHLEHGPLTNKGAYLQASLIYVALI